MKIELTIDAAWLRRVTLRLAVGTLLVAVLYPTWLWASTATIPNAFTAGQVIRAADMNANFSAVKTAIDDNDVRIGNLANLQTTVKTDLVSAVNEARLSGKVVGLTVSKNGTRQVLVNGTSHTLASFSVNKKSATSMLVIQGSLSTWGAAAQAQQQTWQYGAGTEELAQTTTYTLGPGGTSNAARTISTLAVIQGHATTGPQTLVFRMKSLAITRPFLVLNPNSTDNAEFLTGTKAVFLVWEVEP